MPSPELTPPENIEAEQSVLGAMLIEEAAIEKAASLLTCSDFSRPGHQLLFESALALHERNEPVDFITLKAEMEKRGLLEAAGGTAYLTSLFDTVPTAANVEYYARIVSDKAKQRRVWEYATRLMKDASGDVADVSQFLILKQGELERIGTGRKSRSVASRKPFEARMVDLADVSTPDELPLLFGQYLLKGASHWLTGQTGLGKSTLLFNIACALAEGTALWGIECEPTRILYCDMESGDVGRAHKIERLYRDSPRVRGQLLFMREPVKLPDELAEMLAFVQSQQISLVIFDTARRCFSVKDENDNAEVYNRVIPTLDALKMAGVATLTMGHPSKSGNGSARGAGAQEDAGDINLSLIMHQGDVGDANGVIALRVTKNRLLGLGISPLLLRRIGDDQFERVENGESGVPPETMGALLQCRQAVMDYLAAIPEGKASFQDLVAMAVSSGYSKSTLNRALKEMTQQNELGHAQRQGYRLIDPFADD